MQQQQTQSGITLTVSLVGVHKKGVLEKEELNSIIEKIENLNPNEKAFFGFHSLDDGDVIYIKANKYGLELFASELLKASKDADLVIGNPEKNTISFEQNKEWINGDIYLGYIEPRAENRIDIVEESNENAWKNKILSYIFVSVFVVFVFVFIIGVKAIINWF